MYKKYRHVFLILRIREYKFLGLKDVVRFKTSKNKNIHFEFFCFKMKFGLVKLYKTCNWHTSLKMISSMIVNDFSKIKNLLKQP